MRGWYAVALFGLLALWTLFLITTAPNPSLDWLLSGLPFVWALALAVAARAVSSLSGTRMRAGAEAALVVWMPLGAVVGEITAGVFRFVGARAGHHTFIADTLLGFGVGALIALVPAIAIGALVAITASRGWINHISPFKPPLGTLEHRHAARNQR